MAIEKVSLVNIEGGLKKINKTLMKCCESGIFHMNPPPDTSRSAVAAKILRDKGVYERMIKRTETLADKLGIKLDPRAPYDDIEYTVSVDFKNYLDGIDKQQAECSEKILMLNNSLRSQGGLYNILTHLTGFDADFADLFRCRYAKIRFGRIPNGSIRKLAYYSEKTFFFYTFRQSQSYTWCLYITSSEEVNSVDYTFNELGFERTRLPDYLKGNSAECVSMLLDKMVDDLDEKVKLEDKIAEIAAKESKKLSKVYAKLISLNNSYELRTNVTVINARFYFSGYVPAKEAQKFAEMIKSVEDVTITFRDPEPDEPAPVKLKNCWLFRPFEMFVKMYGLPNANGIDPTPLVAITYMLLYGMMFGDVGQGLCIFVIGLLLTKFTKLGLAPIITRIGLSSAAFGVLYGSVFGSEELIEPFFKLPAVYSLLSYDHPPENVFEASTLILIMALIVGVLMILMTMIINIIVSLRMKDYASGIFGASGICGFVLYASLVAGLGLNFALGIDIMNIAYILGLVVLPLLLIFLKEPILEHFCKDRSKERTNGGNVDSGLKARLAKINEEEDASAEPKKKSVGNIIIEGFIDLFETCLTYVTNTMSFLRIGGFVLSHGGLMLVFSIIANMFDGVGSIIVLVIGNIFVTGFEGFIVGIQVLRLEFYELFSRFFKGGGIPFKPASISSDAA